MSIYMAVAFKCQTWDHLCAKYYSDFYLAALS